MLHRLALRVLPSLAVEVTEVEVRRRKRWVMLVLGLVAFVIFRAVKQIDPLSDSLVLLGVSGLISAVTALWAYRMGRQVALATIWRQDGAQRVRWVVGWIGFAYGVQLSLLVLALLRVLVHYDFLRHPDGPAMMAIIIACTSVARDAFEIGHVRKLQYQARPVLTFPDGAALRGLLSERPGIVAAWSALAAVVALVLAAGAAMVGQWGGSELGQLIVVTIAAGSAALAAYLAAERGSVRHGWRALGWSTLFQFWWWPGLVFGATYYLVVLGVSVFVVCHAPALWSLGLMAAVVGALMALYGFYLGHRRRYENRIQTVVPASVLRCPFVMNLLSKGRTGGPDGSVPRPEMLAEPTGRRSS